MALTVGELVLFLQLDESPFDRSIARMEAKAKSAGGNMGKALALGLGTVGVAASKMAIDFDTAFARMVGLAGVPASEVDALKESVLGLAGETAVAPAELAEALYFAASAGLDAAGAMDAVTLSAKGSAAGLGSTTDIVGLVASAVTSYGEANITAAEAVDVLTATIREGRADPAELAGTLGRVLPIASQLKISFDEVGGTVAYLSNVFGDTNRTVTATQGLLTKLLSPSQQGRDALEEMGTSVEELHAAISEDGLLGALELLREHGFAANQEALAKLFDDIEGRSAALALLSDESGSLAAILDETAGSAGALAEAFGVAIGTDGHKAKQVMIDLQVELIKIGQIIMPLASQAIGFAAALADAFSAVPDPLKKVLLLFGGLLAVWGPLSTVFGRLSTMFRVFSDVLGVMAPNAFRVDGALSNLKRTMATGVAAVGVFTLAWQMYNDAMDEAAARGDAATDGIRSAFEGLDPATTTMEEMRTIVSALNDDITAMSDRKRGSQAPWDADFRKELEHSIDAGKSFRGELTDMMYAAEALADEMGISEDAALRHILASDDLTAAVKESSEGFDEETASVDLTVEALNEYSNKLRGMFDPLFALQDAQHNLADAQQAVRDAVAANTDEIDDNNVSQEEMNRLNEDAVRAAVDFETALIDLKAAVENGDVEIADSIRTLQSWADQGIITQQQADDASWSIGLMGVAADNIDGKNPRIIVDAETVAAENKLKTIRTLLGLIPATVGVRVDASYGGPSYRRGAGGPVWPGMGATLVGEHGPELVEWGGVGYVHDAGVTARMLGSGWVDPMTGPGDGGGGNRSITIQNYYPAPEPAMDATGRSLRKISLIGWN